MSDLISRKEVIELLTSRILSSIGIFGDLGGAVSGVRELIKAMPSAEPEEEVFEWCHDCKEYDQGKHCCHRWKKVIRQTLEEMKAEPEMKNGEWIKVGHWGRTYKCNQCGNYLDLSGVNAGRGDANFCPNCGAKMDWSE